MGKSMDLGKAMDMGKTIDIDMLLNNIKFIGSYKCKCGLKTMCFSAQINCQPG